VASASASRGAAYLIEATSTTSRRSTLGRATGVMTDCSRPGAGSDDGPVLRVTELTAELRWHNVLSSKQAPAAAFSLYGTVLPL